MKLILILILLTFSIFEVSAQVPDCEPAPDGIPATDEPPGCIICDLSYFGNTRDYTPDTTVYDFPCGKQENTQWVSVRASGEGLLEFEVAVTVCDSSMMGVEFAVFDQNLKRISGCITVMPEEYMFFSADSLTPGAIYQIMLDGVDGDICDFEILNAGPIDEFFDLIIDPPGNYFCPGKRVCFSIPEWVDSDFFDWGRPPNSFIISGGQPQDSFICVEFTEPGWGTVEVIGENACFLFFNGFLDIDVQLQMSWIESTLCPGDFLMIDGVRYDTTIQTTLFYPILNGDGCDSIVEVDLKISDISPPEIFCAADTFLKAISFWWERPLGAEQYQIFLDNQLITTLDNSSYLFQPDFSKDSIKISIQPLNSIGCDFEKSERMCAIPKISSIRGEQDDSSIKIISNPTGDLVQVESDLKIESIQVFGFSGKEVLFSKEKTIDLSSFSAGIYILKIRSKKHTFMRKVIKL